MRQYLHLRTVFLFVLAIAFFSIDASAQRWKKKKKETLYARNKKKQVSPVYVGIGIKDATAQLHTVGTVRHEGLQVNNNLNSILAIDGNGNVFWRDISSSLANAWFLGGNTASSSAFLGTNNDEDIRIRTNNTQRAIITRGGSVGIGIAAPSAQLHTGGTVRFEGLSSDNTLTRVVAMDANGNLYWRDATTIGTGSNAWLLNGSSASSTSFLGTTNAEDLRIRVNNVQHAVLTTTGSLGIGVAAPTAKLHVSGAVRMESITNNNSIQRIAGFDNNGNLFYKDISSFQTQFWSLTGNSGTNPANHYIGTSDNSRLVFRTNNSERMTILADGKVGINNPAPTGQLVVNSNVPDNHIKVQGVSPSITFEGSPGPNNEGRIGYATVNNNFVNGSLPGDLIVQTLSATSSLIFGTTGGGAGNGVERARITAAGFMGIATSNPTATLHTNGTLRFQGLTNGTGNPLVADASGNIFIGTAGAGNDWALTGNAGTNPATNFLGTTDNVRMGIRTNNIERVTVLADGRVGINTTTPTGRLVINSSTPDNHVRIQGVSPSITFEGSPGLNNEGRIGYATINNNFVNGSLPGDLIVQTLSATSSLIFGTTGGGAGNGVERARINASGFFGIATPTPTAVLHTNGTVRFQNLPTGSGNALVMDANGNLFRSTILTGRPEEISELNDKIDELKKELEELRSVIRTMRGGFIPENTGATLYQNNPNPFSNTTVIRYFLPEETRTASLQVSDLQGNVLATFTLSKSGQQTLAIDGGRFPAGTYLYTLFIDGNRIDSKKMILTK
jgi:hypothetical protein